MRDLYSKCGANCGHCPAFKENITTDEDKQRCSDGWLLPSGWMRRRCKASDAG